ncbi:hypothetical protein FRC03_010496 [Tulasnella sp. 419]|nr:hypothetical protein FRC02_008344 [Tulasnella sp. 418]KAG8957144.1 hypothetical protein FRC03_010496 [Tulasnella sp. 419]
MVQLSDVPPFRGETQEDASEWPQNFVVATANSIESGIIRLLPLYMPRGSPARHWFDGLEGNVKNNWSNFEQHFYDRWIAPPPPTQSDIAWSKFQVHMLKDDELFDAWTLDGGDDTSDVSVAQRRIAKWVEDHRQIGQATEKDDDTLLNTTFILLPPFLRAYIQTSLNPQPKTFQEICSVLEQMPPAVLKHERTRKDLSSDL